jgi:glycosyltransferase involved in cell wall biosynthesis
MSLTVICTTHNEGVYAHATLTNIALARERAAEQGFPETECIIVSDRANDETRRVVTSFISANPWARIAVTEYGDPALARNHAVALTTTNAIALWDGDDLITPNWLVEGQKALKQRGPMAVVVPEYIVTFGLEHIYTRQVDPESDYCDYRGLLWGNFWGPWNIAYTSTYRNCQYEPIFPVSVTGFGGEDWHWNCKALSKGFRFSLVKNTAVFYRRRKGSRLEIDQAAGAKIRASHFFSNPFFIAYCNA